MLSAETSVGAYPVEAVRAMAEIAEAAEEAPEIHGRAREVAPTPPPRRSCTRRSSSPTSSTPTALIVPTSTGGAPRACAKYRRRRPIVALAHSPRVADQLTLEWGVLPDDHAGGRVRRRADRRGAAGRARLRRAVERGARRC